MFGALVVFFVGEHECAELFQLGFEIERVLLFLESGEVLCCFHAMYDVILKLTVYNINLVSLPPILIYLADEHTLTTLQSAVCHMYTFILLPCRECVQFIILS